MNNPSALSRRKFIALAAGAGAAAALAPSSGGLLAAEGKRWPVGCRDLYLKNAGKPDSWSCMKALGAEVTEVAVETNLHCANLFHPDRKYSVDNEEDVKTLADDLKGSGCRISAFLMSNRFDEQLDKELEAARGLVKAAQTLGVKAIRIDVVPRAMAGEDFLPFAISTCKKLCEIADGSGVRFGLENHSKVANDPAFLDKLFDGVGSPNFGLNLDLGNFYWWGHSLESLYGLYERYAPRAIHTHCKNINYPEDKRNSHRPMGWEYDKYDCPVYAGDIDYKRVVAILRKANYQGDLCVEDEALGKFPAGERGSVIRKEIEYLAGLEG